MTLRKGDIIKDTKGNLKVYDPPSVNELFDKFNKSVWGDIPKSARKDVLLEELADLNRVIEKMERWLKKRGAL